MSDQCTMVELLQAPIEGYEDAIVILAENFELKHGLLNLVTSKQFYEFEKEDPHAHIRWFNKITSTIKYRDVPNSHINQFFPPSKTTNLQNEIMNFQQRFDESFCEAWDHFKDLLRACPHHGFTELHQLDTFYNALTPTDQDSLNAAAGGNLLTKTPSIALTIIENKSKVHNSRNKPIVTKVSTNAPSSSTPHSSEIAALVDAVEAMLTQKSSPPASVKAVKEIYVTYGGLHPYHQCLGHEGKRFLKYRDNIQGYVSAAAVNYNQGNTGYRPQSVANQIRPSSFAQPNVQNNQTRYNQGYNQNRGNNQGNLIYQNPIQQTQVAPSNELSNYKKINDANMKAMQNQINNVKNELRNEMQTSIQTSMSNQTNELKNMIARITTQSGISYDGPPIPPPFSSLPKVVEREPEVTKDTVQPKLVECLALADLDRSYYNSTTGIAEDVFVKVGKFHSQANFVVVDYVVDPRVPLILGRPFLRTARALIDVYGKELTLRVDDEVITFKYAQEVLGFSDSSTSGNPTPSLDPILLLPFPPSITPFKESGDLLLLEKLLNDEIHHLLSLRKNFMLRNLKS
ncbi:reverse transcriptase domain-containing protein [Tanacetum coccineum]